MSLCGFTGRKKGARCSFAGSAAHSADLGPGRGSSPAAVFCFLVIKSCFLVDSTSTRPRNAPRTQSRAGVPVASGSVFPARWRSGVVESADREDLPGVAPRPNQEAGTRRRSRLRRRAHACVWMRTWGRPHVDTLTWPACSGTYTCQHAHVHTGTQPWRFGPAGSETPSGPRSICTFNPETVSTEAWRRTKCQVCAERRSLPPFLAGDDLVSFRAR